MSSLPFSSIIGINGLIRRPTRTVSVGGVQLGGNYPIRLQSMTTTDTNQTESTTQQCITIADAGADIVRSTTQGVKEARSLGIVKQELIRRGYTIPVVADIHFNPKAALEAAEHVDKVRINPGNYSDTKAKVNFTETEYAQELTRIEERLLPLLRRCAERGVAMRIGVNHGSLSARIMDRYGDTPMGMAQAAMEFLRVCAKHSFHNVVVSMKSSNTRVMVYATRLLVMLMDAEGMDYPLHLGVTEAGEGEDGRIRSSVGIGALLADGIGDTIRVSLTEPPENEIPVAKALVNHFATRAQAPQLNEPTDIPYNPTEYSRRPTTRTDCVGGDSPPVVLANLSNPTDLTLESLRAWGWELNSNSSFWRSSSMAADFIYIAQANPQSIPLYSQLPLIGSSEYCQFPLANINNLPAYQGKSLFFLETSLDGITPNLIADLKQYPEAVLILRESGSMAFNRHRASVLRLMRANLPVPCITAYSSNADSSRLQIEAAADCGPLFLDGLSDGIMIKSSLSIEQEQIKSLAFGVLQAARVRFTRTEFISCPGCGRTLFNLTDTLKQVKERTQHLKGLKIAVMGCIVNGPGEMADADYGYVGAGPNRVTLYKGREVMKQNIPTDKAVDELISLIKASDQWQENTGTTDERPR